MQRQTKKITSSQLRQRRAEALLGFLKKQKLIQDQLMLETTSIKDMKK